MVFAREASRGLAVDGVEVVEFFVESRVSMIALVRDWIQIRRLLRRGGFAAVHAQYGAVTGLLCALAAGKQAMVLSIRGSDLNVVPSINCLRNHLTRLMSQWAAWRANAVVCVSEALRAQLWCEQDKVVVIPSGVDVEIFKPIDRSVARSELDWEPQEPVVLFNAGRSPLQKGLPLVVEAMGILGGEGFKARLHVTNGDQNRLDMARLFNAADCLVLASETEGSPNVVKEAMACNLPVVSVDVGDVRERLFGVTPGTIVLRNARALADGIRHVLQAGRRSNGGIALQRQRLHQQDSVAKLCELYISLPSMRRNHWCANL